jgi:hypothetical protein
VERGEEGARLDLEGAAGDLLDAPRDAEAVVGAERQRFQDEDVERPLHEVRGRHGALL